jgi:BlaI family penicillinase repressor
LLDSRQDTRDFAHDAPGYVSPTSDAMIKTGEKGIPPPSFVGQLLTARHHFTTIDTLSSLFCHRGAIRSNTNRMTTAKQPAMSDAEREVLKVLWEQGPLGVRDILSSLTESGQEWTRSTVVTLLHRLEAKHYIVADKTRYAFVYRPLASREDVMHARVRELASELSEGEPVPLMLAFAERHRFTAEELARLEQMIERLKCRQRSKKRQS